MNTYREMNEKIAGILRFGDSFAGLYAAARIEELEAEVERLQAKYTDVINFMEDIRTMARHRNPKGATILDFMAVWNEQYQDKIKKLEIEVERLKVVIDDLRHGQELAESEIAGRDQEIERLKAEIEWRTAPPSQIGITEAEPREPPPETELTNDPALWDPRSRPAPQWEIEQEAQRNRHS